MKKTEREKEREGGREETLAQVAVLIFAIKNGFEKLCNVPSWYIQDIERVVEKIFHFE